MASALPQSVCEESDLGPAMSTLATLGADLSSLLAASPAAEASCPPCPSATSRAPAAPPSRPNHTTFYINTEAEARKERGLPAVTRHPNHKKPSLKTVAGLSLRCDTGGWAGGTWVGGGRRGSQGCCNLARGTDDRFPPSHGSPPDSFMGIPPERNHFVDFQGTGPAGTSWAGLQGAILHFGQEVLGKGAAHVAAATILKRAKEAGALGSWWQIPKEPPVHLSSDHQAQNLKQTSLGKSPNATQVHVHARTCTSN